ncbi:D-Ala-D-Ala carboxypeptidase family metallohydrolase [Hoeflea sp. YIM 152468]|uniref:YcbK family protein n=1 Tax=Hoeflea sp. YIM 152468 TaxID=3031759 RepID=UPI0023DBE8B5|nr:D-Ala-D-Ala carboxypeptidase family metallohydrolase [Hoeflea sp. YIM 152468]MDF1609920.1 D-Ala-D-Ala carboxypeptidase family metallohydrolase [Hoeflea sp. YIM 152468]
MLTGAVALLSGCVSAGDPATFASQGFAPGASSLSDSTMMVSESDAMFLAAGSTAAADSNIPLPVPSPASADGASRQAVADPVETDIAQPPVMADTSIDALNRGITQNQLASAPANLYAAPPAPEVIEPQPAEPADQAQSAPAEMEPESEEAAAPPPVQELAVIAPPKKKSIFARMFAPQQNSSRKAPAGTKKRVVSSMRTQVNQAAASSGGDTLPGVRLAALFGVDADTSTGRSSAGQIELASAAGLARLAPNGLHRQTENVDVDCFKPELVRVLKSIERHYGRPVVVTSGYRSPRHNRRIGGASGSRHTSCEAADVQIEGVSKWQLAKYLRSMPGRGGVGTYCHTESVHIDIGNPRDWNWRCRRRK